MPIISKGIFYNGRSQIVTVTVTGDFGYSTVDETLICETAMGLKGLHDTKKARGIPSNALGYIHNYAENTIYAVTAMASVTQFNHTMTITKAGEVKNGNHVFK